eukprot:gene31981-39507_t
MVVLSGVTLPIEMAAMIDHSIDTYCSEASNNKQPANETDSSNGIASKSLLKNVRDAETKLKALKAQRKPSDSEQAEARLEALQEEIRRIEAGSVPKESHEISAVAAAKAKREDELLKRLAETKKRSKLIAALQAQLRETASLDLVFALDCTGFMVSYIDAAKNNIRQVADSLTRLYPDVPLRVAFIGYRDHCDGSARLEVMRFTTKMEEFKTFVGKMVAQGGRDTPEDVFGALRVAETMEWQSATRILYHIGDAPCHGKPEFHDYADSYPG